MVFTIPKTWKMIKVIRSGFYTTVQDMGRFGYRNKGVPVSGVMDENAAKELNRLLDNKPTDALLEVTMIGPKLEFTTETLIALGGADFNVTLNGKSINNYSVQNITKGDVLEYGNVKEGIRGYLAIKGGVESKITLGSRSFYFPLTLNKCLKKGDTLVYSSFAESKELKSNFDTGYLSETVIEVYRGPEFHILTDRQLGQLFGKNFTVAKENNRMAYQLEELLDEHSESMLTSATLPGTVQLTPSGKLIVLMKDGQTTGGYPRCLQLSEKAISILAQKQVGNKILFKMG